MKPHIHFATVLLIIGLLPSAITAQETNDSTVSDKSGKTRDLQELVVEGDLSTADARGVTYVPTARQKRVAQSAGDLLLRMAIPQVNVDPLNSAISSATETTATHGSDSPQRTR